RRAALLPLHRRAPQAHLRPGGGAAAGATGPRLRRDAAPTSPPAPAGGVHRAGRGGAARRRPHELLAVPVPGADPRPRAARRRTAAAAPPPRPGVAPARPPPGGTGLRSHPRPPWPLPSGERRGVGSCRRPAPVDSGLAGAVALLIHGPVEAVAFS